MGRSLLKSIIFTLFFHFATVSAFSQQQSGRISLDYKNISLPKLIDTIRVKANLKIAYDVDIIPIDSLLTIQVTDEEPLEVLIILLSGLDVEVLHDGNQIVIRDKKEPVISYFELSGGVVDC